MAILGGLGLGVLATTLQYNLNKAGYGNEYAKQHLGSAFEANLYGNPQRFPVPYGTKQLPNRVEKAPPYDPPSFTYANRIKKGSYVQPNHRTAHIPTKSNALVPYVPKTTPSATGMVSRRYYTYIRKKRNTRKKKILKRRRNKKKKSAVK